jgi:hypothetical protein
MQVMILEGTLAEVMRKVNELHVGPNSAARLTIEDSGTRELPAGSLKNGVAQIPTKDPDTVVTSELVARLSEE